MDADGKNVKRLTNTPGYDGGAFFSADCTQDRVARVAPARARRSTTTRACSRKGLVRPDQARALRRQRRRLRREAGHVARTPRRSRPFFYPTRQAHPLLLELRRPEGPRVRHLWRSTSTARDSSASRTRPASTASRCSRPTARPSRSRRTEPPPGHLGHEPVHRRAGSKHRPRAPLRRPAARPEH